MIVAAASMLVGPIPTPTRAQEIPPHGFGIHGWFIARAHYLSDEEPVVNRLARPGQLTNAAMQAVIVCRGDGDGITDPDEVVVANLASDHPIELWADDDITDGFGEFTPTDTDRQFRDPTAMMVRGGGVDSNASVSVRVVSGRHHRVGNVIEAQIELDMRVVDSNGTLRCQTRSSRPIVIRIKSVAFHEPLERRYIIIGVFRRHYFVVDQPFVSRAVCDIVGPHVPTRVPDPLMEGDPFHPCAPRYRGA